MKVRITAFFIAALLAIAAFPFNAQATMYSYVDEDGVVHFSNVPSNPNYQPVVRERRPKLSVQTSSGQILIPGNARDWDPDPEYYDQMIREASQRYQVDPRLIKSVIRAESNFNYLAVSRKGALGLMQLMPSTADDMQVLDPFDPQENIDGGTRYLRKMLGMFNGNLRMALAAYNAGPNRVIKLGRVPHLKETKEYISRVQYFYNEYRKTSSPSKRWAKYYYDRNS